MSVAELAEEAGYTKRNVAAALSDLATVGIVLPVREGNTDKFGIEGKREAVLKLFGPVPVETGSFVARCRALLILIDRLGSLGSADPRVQFVEATRALADTSRDLGRSGIPLHLIPSDAEPGSPVQGWMGSLIQNLLMPPPHHLTM
ncbi:MAG: hypothetical protein ACKVXR_12130 [Planctomycetota bacterium]